MKQGGNFLELSGGPVINVEPHLEGGYRGVVTLQVLRDVDISGPLSIPGFSGVKAQAHYKRNDRVFSFELYADELSAFRPVAPTGRIPTDDEIAQGLPLLFEADGGPEFDKFSFLFNLSNAGAPGKPDAPPAPGPTGLSLDEVERTPWVDLYGRYPVGTRTTAGEITDAMHGNWKDLQNTHPTADTPAEARKMQSGGGPHHGGGPH